MTVEDEVKAPKRSWRFWVLVVSPGLLVSLGLGCVLCSEALHVGPLAGPGVVESYHFGSDAMVGEGGWRYMSRAVYVRSTAIEGICLVLGAAPFMVALVRRRLVWAVGGYMGLLLVIVVTNHWHI